MAQCGYAEGVAPHSPGARVRNPGLYLCNAFGVTALAIDYLMVNSRELLRARTALSEPRPIGSGPAVGRSLSVAALKDSVRARRNSRLNFQPHDQQVVPSCG